MLFEISEPNQSPNPHERRYAIGIDLGTTHSLVAAKVHGNTQLLLDESERALLPSCVCFDGDEVFIGWQAIAMAKQKNLHLYQSFKREMMENFTELKQQSIYQNTSPIELSAHILKALYDRALQSMHGDCLGAVITVPAYFDEAARQATKDAAKLAGIEVLRLINEPTAAALAYGLDGQKQGTFLIYDLGGGTFDVSILKIENDIFEVLATKGDTHLGGDDFDAALLNLIEQTAQNKAFVTIEPQQVKTFKEQLSSQTAIHIELANQQSIEITQQAFIACSQNLLNQTILLTKQALKDAKLSTEMLTGIVLVGGSTRMPQVAKTLALEFACPIFNDLNPDEIVAIGAAKQAQKLTQTQDVQDDWLLLDVLALSLGIETMGGLSEKIIERNSPLPIECAQEFTTGVDGQTAISLHIVQGERELASQNRTLHRMVLTGIQAMPAGQARILVNFSVDSNGLLSVKASDSKTGQFIATNLQPSSGLSDDLMLEMLQSSWQHAQQDMQARMLIEAQNDAKQLLYATEQALKQDLDLLNDAELTVIKNAMIELQNLLIKSNQNNQSNEDNESKQQTQDQQKPEEPENFAQKLKEANEAFGQLTEDFAFKRINRSIGEALQGVSIASV